MAQLNWGQVAIHSFLPAITFSRNQIYLICAMLGTTISPYLFFWQTSQEVEEENLRQEKRRLGWHQEVSSREVKQVRTDVWSGMFFSNLVMFFIIAACAGTLYVNGITNIATAADAALALKPFAGEAT